MIPILDWIFEGIVGWVSSIASQLLDAVSGLFLEALGTDMTAMEEYFPFVTKAYGVMQVTAYAILILIVLWQLFRAFGGPITEAENPWHLVVRGAIFGFLIGYAKPIFSACLTIARAPYTSLMDLSMTGEDFTFAGVEQALTNGLTTLVATASVVGLILILILLIALGWNYFKLLLETVERYIVVGVLCYTSPLAFSMGASKSTNNVFKSWCRMVGSQLLLLVMNVWFLRGFASSMGHFIGNGGALTTGKGSIFLWMFCALAYLKCAQRFDSYLASMGLNVAQTGSSMGMELLMAARVISGVGSGARSAGSVFGRAGGGATATGTGAAATGFAAGFASRFSPNSYVRDAVVEGGTRMGFSGGAGFVGRAFGGIAARNGATLNGQSISSVASRAPGASGTIAGDIADRSLSNYMPHMQGFQMKGTQITGGRISTTATTPDGKKANVDMYSASQFEKPDAPHSVVTASDGSQWYQMASGEGRGAFYDAPVFGGMDAQAAAGGVNADAVNPTPGESAAGTEVPGAHTDAPGVSAGENIVPGAEGAPQNVGEFPGDQTHIVPGAVEGMQPEGIIPGGAEVPGVQTDASGAPVSEGIVPGSDAMPQGVATFPGDQMHETAGMSEGIVPGGIHMPETGGEDSVPGMVGQQLDGAQLGVMPSADPANIGEQIHVPDAEGQALGAAVVAAAGPDMAPSELGGDAGDIPHPIGTIHGEGVPADGMEVPQTGSGFMPEFMPNQIPGDSIAGAGEMPSVSGGDHIISASAEGGMEVPQTGSGFVPELAGQPEVNPGIGGSDVPGFIPGDQSIPAASEGAMEAPEFGAAFVGSGSDGNIIAFPGGTGDVATPAGDSVIPDAANAGTEVPQFGAAFVSGSDVPGEMPAFTGSVADSTYKSVTVTVVTRIEAAGIVNGIPRYNYTTERKTYYLPDETKESEEEITVPAYKEVTVTVPVYSGGQITGTRRATYYESDGTEVLEPTTEIIEYAECTIHPFDNTVIADAFGIDMSAEYPQFKLTYGEVIQNMANALKMTLYGTLGNGTAVPLTDAELIAFVNRQNCNATRKHILTTALSLVGKVPYFWGGKSAAGWNDEWNTPKLVTSAGSSSTGTIRPFGLDCSGFTDWTYKTAVGVSLHAGTYGQWDNSYAIDESELLPGDLGFLMNDGGSGWNHVLIFAGYGEDGSRKWVHSEGGIGVHLNTPSYEGRLSLRRPKNVDFDQEVGSSAYGEPLYSLQVNVTHYCACTRCCGPNAQGITASGKRVAVGMVAMSSHYPFGTQIMINGIMYTVEDRGGSGIENNIGRVDIYVPDHNEALRMGRYDTTAYIYRIGR